jgi:hypothetical protein
LKVRGYHLSTLAKIFNPERLESIDPNLPEMQPLLKANQALKNQAFVRWYDEVGHYLVDSLESAIIGKIVKALGHPRNTVDEIILNVRLLDEIRRDISFVDHIVNAYQEEEKRKKSE